jgi:integrase
MACGRQLQNMNVRIVVILPLNFSRAVRIKNFQKRWERVRTGANLIDFHWHDWRHTSTTMLKQIGAADEVIQEVLGHADVEQTRDYINAKEEQLKP